MAARREADDADPLRVDAPFRRPAADQANRALGVELRAQRRLALDLAGTPRASVLEDDAGHAPGVQPGRHLLAFELPVEVPVAAARADHHRRPGVLVLVGPVDGEGRLGDVGDQLRRPHEGRLVDPAGFLALDADVARHLPRPEVDDQRIGREGRDGHERADEQRGGESDSMHEKSPLGRLTMVLGFSPEVPETSTGGRRPTRRPS